MKKGKGGEIDYEIELLNNLLNSEYTNTQGMKGTNNMKDAYQIILD